MKTISTDVLVIGDGLAGLTAAFTAASEGADVLLVSKGGQASPAVIGFSCVIREDDSPALFSDDILNAGEHINRPDLVNAFAQDAKYLPEMLISLGLFPDREGDRISLIRSLGHSVPRLFHRGLVSGSECMALLEKQLGRLKVHRSYSTMCLSLMQNRDSVRGAMMWDIQNQEMLNVKAGAVVLATGGCHLMRRSTYPADLTGDGCALAYQAGARLTDMEFIQFEPLRCADKPIGLSTTMLAKGGILLDRDGKRFVLDSYMSETEPTKDELSRLIAVAVLNGRGNGQGGVWVDMTHLDDKAVGEHQRIYDRFTRWGIDLRTTPVSVAPAAHSMMGGVLIDAGGATGVPGLFAAGEVTGGLHGASRLGGNAGSEAFIMGRRAGAGAAAAARNFQPPECPETKWEEKLSLLLRCPVLIPDPGACLEKARAAMAEGMGPVRTEEGIQRALDTLDGIAFQAEETGLAGPEDLPGLISLRDQLLVSRIACRAALARRESRGAHARLDHPSRWEEAKQIHFQKDTGMTIEGAAHG